jgi:hypothetical protein
MIISGVNPRSLSADSATVLAYFLQCDSISTSFTDMSIKKCAPTPRHHQFNHKHTSNHTRTKTPRHAETWHKNTKTSPVLIKTCHKNTKTSPVLIKSTRKHQGVTVLFKSTQTLLYKLTSLYSQN